MIKYILTLLVICATGNLSAQLSKGYQKFLINSSRDTVLFGEKGTELRVPAFAFTDSSGAVFQDAPITILLKEVYDQADMIMEGVSTESPEGILVSDGMVEVRGKLGEMDVLINPEKPIEVRIASLSGAFDMELYSASDSLEGSSWNREEGRLKVDTCRGYRKVYFYEDKEFSKGEFLTKKRAAKKRYMRRRKSGASIIGDTMIIFHLDWDGWQFDYRKDENNNYWIPVMTDSAYECTNEATVAYAAELFEFGWYNLDKLWKGKEALRSIMVLSNNASLNVMLYFPNGNAALVGRRTSKGYYFGRCATDEMMVLVAFSFRNQNEVSAMFREIDRFSPTLELGDFKRMPKGLFERRIRELQE